MAKNVSLGCITTAKSSEEKPESSDLKTRKENVSEAVIIKYETEQYFNTLTTFLLGSSSLQWNLVSLCTSPFVFKRESAVLSSGHPCCC